MERIIYFEPGFDKRDPNPHKDYGIHGMQIRFLLKGKHGAVQFLLFTEWSPKHVQKERPARAFVYSMVWPMAADIGYHAYEPQYEGQEPAESSCPYLDGKPCHYDGSTVNAEPIRDRFLAEGDEAVWEEMERRYIEQFGALE